MEHSVHRPFVCVAVSEKSNKKKGCREELEQRNGGVCRNEKVK